VLVCGFIPDGDKLGFSLLIPSVFPFTTHSCKQTLIDRTTIPFLLAPLPALVFFERASCHFDSV
jgi:hypothetical protein